jgi:hypothetical protein
MNGVAPNWQRDELFTNGAGRPVRRIRVRNILNSA